MLSGVKFIPRVQISKAGTEKRKKPGDKRVNHTRTSKSPKDDSSSDDDIGRIKKGSAKNKKWYSSDEHSSEDSSETESEGSFDQNEKKGSRREKNKTEHHNSGIEDSDRPKKISRSAKKHYLSEEDSSCDFEERGGEGGKNKSKGRGEKDEGHSRSSQFAEDLEIARKEMGLDWMLRPPGKTDGRPAMSVEDQPEELHAEDGNKINPRELNPYLKNNGSGYPDEAEEHKVGRLPSSSVVGDGGASWRLKALKRAQEQAAREVRKLEEVVEERWGSLSQFTLSAVSHTAAPVRAHLHAIRNRKRGPVEERGTNADNQSKGDVKKNDNQGYMKDASVGHPEMRAPKVHDSLSWGKRKSQHACKDAGLVSTAVSSLNKFADDGSFMSKVLNQQDNDPAGSVTSCMNQGENEGPKATTSEMNEPSEGITSVNETLSANRLAAKALLLRMKGRHEAAEKLMGEAENLKKKRATGETSSRRNVGRINRYVAQDISAQRKEDDSDRQLAQKIIQNKQYSLSARADDEYDFEDGPSKSRKKGAGNDHKSTEKNVLAKRILTQQERCLFCFENPNRPKHLVVSIANFSYLMLPQWQPVVPGHCCILPMQHESAARTVDNNVWEEIRNFKKCLIMMFAKQEKDLVFLETVMGLAKQRRHCLIECIPLPRKIAKAAPLYFKKAIDEAEDEWSQHNAKKLIDTSVKGLRNSIPKDFPYFHVEFGLDKGFVHVIDDERQFKSGLGLNVIRGMLQLPEEDMYRRRRHESVEAQRWAVANFARHWEPVDWTKQLD